MLTAGAAMRDITPALGSVIQGASVNQVAKSVRDPLQANALYLTRQPDGSPDSSASTKLLLVSCDVANFDPPTVKILRENIAQATGLEETAILLGATHTHAGPSLNHTSYFKKVDHAYIQKLAGWLVEVAQEAIANTQPAELGWAQGQQQIGYNRRCCWADGTHTMHGDTTRPDFTGLEGPADPTQTVIAVRKLGKPNQLIALFHANTSHPTVFYGCDFFSADFPGYARHLIQQVYGAIPILFFNGAQGDISCEDMLVPHYNQAENREQKLARLGSLLAGRTFELLYHVHWKKDVTFIHEFQTLDIPVRLPTPQALQDAKDLLARVDQGQQENPLETAMAHGTVLLDKSFATTPTDTVRLHAIQLDELALANTPCELYSHFGLQIRRRSPMKATAFLGLTDGGHGYCPTLTAIRGGGYSGRPIFWTRLSEDAGDRIVDTLSAMLRKVHAQA